MAAPSDTKILKRLVNPSSGSFKRAAAEGLLSLRFSDADVSRMNELAAKARAGSLTPEQQREAESYNRVGHFMALVHSKARLSLKQAAKGRGGGR